MGVWIGPSAPLFSRIRPAERGPTRQDHDRQAHRCSPVGQLEESNRDRARTPAFGGILYASDLPLIERIDGMA